MTWVLLEQKIRRTNTRPRRPFPLWAACAAIGALLWTAALAKQAQAAEAAAQDANARKAAFVKGVVGGAGLMPWQTPGPSSQETAFREKMEARKTRMLAHARDVRHPVLLSDEEIARARRTIERTDWGRKWFADVKKTADEVAGHDDAWIDRMISELTPWQHYGFTCPNCVGVKSQEGVGGRIVAWSSRYPDVIRCNRCGQTYPDAKFPETATLQAPRMGQSLTFYLNEREREHPDDRTGKLAYHWVGRPIHVSFSGSVRQHKASFMISAGRSLALAYQLTGEARYADKAVKILVRLARCYRRWLYHDYWDTVADCDPLYAAWHDRDLKLEWKRHLCSQAYKNDTSERARMLQNYWGAGRLWPSTGSVSCLPDVCLTYDLVCEAKDASGRPLWTDAMRAEVERDLLLEWIMDAEPYVGGEGKATCPNNKAPRIYMAQAAVAKTLGVPELADVALRGYETVRDRSFTFDGFSRESPAYTNMYLGALLMVPETLHGFVWPSGFKARQGALDLYRSDPMLRLMLLSVLDQLCPDGRYPPLSDTSVSARPSTFFFELGLNRLPDAFRGKMPSLYAGRRPTEYALFHCEPEELERHGAFDLPEIWYPGWMTAFLRHGQGRGASMLAMPANPEGGHRHRDNLSLFYVDRGHVVLGDQGYIGDMPQNRWIHDARSHNLVVVDEADQNARGRRPRLHMMFTTPIASVVECSTDAYPMCRQYRRTTVLIKGPEARTFLVDIFRVEGGKRRAYRIFSEVGASDAEAGVLEFVGASLPAEKPLPNFGGSVQPEHIYGLRDVRSLEKPAPGWQAVWRQKGRAYRMRMLSAVDRLEASNGPGQELHTQLGRRVRYVDAVDVGDDRASVFVAIHEPSGVDGATPVRAAKLLALPPGAGKDAVAVKIQSDWGTYLVLSDVDSRVEVDGVSFQGKFGLVRIEPDGKRRLVACGASTMTCGDLGFVDRPARWTGQVTEYTDTSLVADAPAPDGFDPIPPDCRNYVLIPWGKYVTGWPVAAFDRGKISVQRFGLKDPKRFDLPALRVLGK